LLKEDISSSHLGVSFSLISALVYMSLFNWVMRSRIVYCWRNLVLVSMFRKIPSLRHFTWQV
jgi:hypothetical protein